MKPLMHTFATLNSHLALRSFALFLLILCPPVVSILYAEELAPPTDDVLLTLTGNIQNGNAKDDSGSLIAEFDLAMLEALGSTKIETENPWVEGLVQFEGIRLNKILQHVGGGSQTFIAYAADDYSIETKGIDFEKYPVIIAYKRDGEYIGVRDLGPLWIIYPFSDYPEISTEYTLSVSVWQLIRMEVK